MSAHVHHRHPASTRFSLLRASAGTRLAIAAVAACIVWLAAAWSLGWT